MAWTTPEHRYDFEQMFPSMRGAARKSLRLHPRQEEGLPPDVSKIGGVILWPRDAPRPICPEQQCPLVPVLQLFERDFPNIDFPKGRNLLQVLWYPQYYEECGFRPKLDLRWHDSSQLDGFLEPDYINHDPCFEVNECRIDPEEVVEYPYVDQLTEEQSSELFCDGQIRDYQYLWSVCPGTKVGGYPDYAGQDSWIPRGDNGQPLEYLLTISDDEWDDGSRDRWLPLEQDYPPKGRKEMETVTEGDQTSTRIHTVYTPEEQQELETWTEDRWKEANKAREAIGTYLKQPLNIFLDHPWAWETA